MGQKLTNTASIKAFYFCYKKKTHFHSHSLPLHHLLEILEITLSTEVALFQALVIWLPTG